VLEPASRAIIYDHACNLPPFAHACAVANEKAGAAAVAQQELVVLPRVQHALIYTWPLNEIMRENMLLFKRGIKMNSQSKHMLCEHKQMFFFSCIMPSIFH